MSGKKPGTSSDEEKSASVQALAGSEERPVPAFEKTPRNAAAKSWLSPSNGLTWHQFFYIFIMDGLGGMVISGGINFALAFGMIQVLVSGRHSVAWFNGRGYEIER
jgi:hypothetical protein